MGGQSCDQLGAGAHTLGLEEARRVPPQRLSQHYQTQREETGDAVPQPGHPKQPGGPAAGEPQDAGDAPRAPLFHELPDDQVGPGLEVFHHLLHALRRMGEVRVEGDRAVALRPVGPLQRQPQQLFQAARIAAAIAVRDDRHRQHFGVRRQHLPRVVGRGVVQDQQLVFAGKRREYLAHLPQHQAGRPSLVVGGDADVDHGPAI